MSEGSDGLSTTKQKRKNDDLIIVQKKKKKIHRRKQLKDKDDAIAMFQARKKKKKKPKYASYFKSTSATEDLRSLVGLIEDADEEEIEDPDAPVAVGEPMTEEQIRQAREEEERQVDGESESEYIPVPAPEYTEDALLLGLDNIGTAYKCFGCEYTKSKSAAGAIEYEKYKRLDTFFRDNFYNMKFSQFCIRFAELYEEIRKEANMHIPHGEEKLPPWSAGQIYTHYRTHHVSPRIQQYLQLRHLQSSMFEMEKSCLWKSKKREVAGKVYRKPKKEEWKLFSKIQSDYFRIASMNPSKLVEFGPSAIASGAYNTSGMGSGMSTGKKKFYSTSRML